MNINPEQLKKALKIIEGKAQVSSKDVRTFKGYVEFKHEAGMEFVYLNDKQGNEPIFIGSSLDIKDENPKLMECLVANEESNVLTSISGHWEMQEEGVEAFALPTVTCQRVAK